MLANITMKLIEPLYSWAEEHSCESKFELKDLKGKKPQRFGGFDPEKCRSLNEQVFKDLSTRRPGKVSGFPLHPIDFKNISFDLGESYAEGIYNKGRKNRIDTLMDDPNVFGVTPENLDSIRGIDEIRGLNADMIIIDDIGLEGDDND